MYDEEELNRIDFYYDNPKAFVEDLVLQSDINTALNPTEQQSEVLQILEKKKRITVRSGNGVGKTTLEAWTILWFMYTHPNCRVVATAPTNHQLIDILWPELKKWWEKSLIRDLFEWTATSFYNKKEPDTWFATAMSTDESTRMQGFHEDNILFIIDEASGVGNEIWEAIRGSLTTKNAHVLMCGNPNYLTGFFHDTFLDTSSFKKFKFSALDSPNVSKESIEEIEKDYGVESNMYRVRVLGEFPLESGSTLYFPMSLIKYSIVNADKHLHYSPSGDYVYDLGLDPARTGDDEAVYCISAFDESYTPHKTLRAGVYWEHYPKSDGPFLINRTTILYNIWKFANIYPDETGMGGFLYDFMRKDERLPITPISYAKTFDKNSPIKDNNKEAMFKGLKSLFERQRQHALDKEKGLIDANAPNIFEIPNIPRLITQLCGMQFEYTGPNHDTLKIFHEEGSHDDWVHALALSLFRTLKTKKKSSYSIA